MTKLRIDKPNGRFREIELEAGAQLEITEAFSGVSIKTEVGTFGLVERDGGLWVMKDGKEILRCDQNGSWSLDMSLAIDFEKEPVKKEEE